jgi:hypothetical protein
VSTSATVPLGALAPLQFVMNITPGDANVDLSTVIEAVLQVRQPSPDRTVSAWAVTMSNKTPTTLTLTHSYGLGDLPLVGQLMAYALLTLSSGGTLPTTSVTLLVVDPFQDPGS